MGGYIKGKPLRGSKKKKPGGGGSAKQKAAASKATAAMHKKYPAGKQTPAQLTAEKNNLQAARDALAYATGFKVKKPPSAALLRAEAAYVAAGKAAWAKGEAIWKAHEWKSWAALTPAQQGIRKGRLAGNRSLDFADLRGRKGVPLGMHSLIAINLKTHPSHRKPTGIFKRVPKRIAPSAFDERTGWRQSRSHKYKKRIHLRKPKVKRVRKWRHRKHDVRPR